LPPPPVKSPLQARFFDTVPLLSCTVPQFPLPMLVVKLRRVGFTPQHAAWAMVVVVVDVVVATVVDVVVVAPCEVEVVVVGPVVAVVTVVLVDVATVVLLVVVAGAVDVVCVVLVVAIVLVVVVATPPGQVQSARQSSMAPPGDVGGHVGLPGGSHCSPGSRNELPHDDVGRLVLEEDDDEDVVVTVTVVVVSVVPVVDVVTGEDVVVVPTTQSGPVQASQQLGTLPTHELPSGGA
jgi:hypothetical protein